MISCLLSARIGDALIMYVDGDGYISKTETKYTRRYVVTGYKFFKSETIRGIHFPTGEYPVAYRAVSAGSPATIRQGKVKRIIKKSLQHA